MWSFELITKSKLEVPVTDEQEVYFADSKLVKQKKTNLKDKCICNFDYTVCQKDKCDYLWYSVNNPNEGYCEPCIRVGLSMEIAFT